LKVTCPRTLADVDRDLAVVSGRILDLNRELDSIPRVLHGSRKWLDRIDARSRLLKKRAELHDERRGFVAAS
jgi:hypothetical protein